MGHSKNPTSFVTTLSQEQIQTLKNLLEEKGFVFSKRPHAFFHAKSDTLHVSIVAYLSLKVTFQGSGLHEFLSFDIEPLIFKDTRYTESLLPAEVSPKIGCDEAGKGDVFGPLCVASIAVDQKGCELLSSLKVQDSKNLKDPQIHKIATELKAHFPYHVFSLKMTSYNETYAKFKNLNRMLAWMHSVCIEELLKKTSLRHVLVDQFASKEVLEGMVKQKNLPIQLEQRTKAEEDLVVAAASILARDHFVQQMNQLSEQYKLTLPKGATHVQQALDQFVFLHGKDALKFVAKLHFKTLQPYV